MLNAFPLQNIFARLSLLPIIYYLAPHSKKQALPKLLFIAKILLSMAAVEKRERGNCLCLLDESRAF